MNDRSTSGWVTQSPDPSARFSAAMVRSPGWYPDPHGGGQRWWTGQHWSSHVSTALASRSPQAEQATTHVVVNSSTVVAIGPRKSVGAAFVLTLLFGPLGMFYSTVPGGLFMGLVMIVGSAAVGVATLGLGAPVFMAGCWLLCIIWGCASAASR